MDDIFSSIFKLCFGKRTSRPIGARLAFGNFYIQQFGQQASVLANFQDGFGVGELSNVSVMGVEGLESPSHREHFTLVQYTSDPIEGFNRGSLGFTKFDVDVGADHGAGTGLDRRGFANL